MRSEFIALIVMAGMIVAAPAASALSPPVRPAAPSPMLILVQANADPVGAHAAIERAQERLSEIDATVTVLEQDAQKLSADGRKQVQASIDKLRATRDAYKGAVDKLVADGQTMTAEQLAAARAALLAPGAAFERQLDAAVGALKLGIADRKALVEARLAAAQLYWRKSIADLKAKVATVAADKRAAIEARITRLQASADDAQARLDKIERAGRGAWAALKKGFADSRRAFDETYGSVNKEIGDGTQ